MDITPIANLGLSEGDEVTVIFVCSFLLNDLH